MSCWPGCVLQQAYGVTKQRSIVVVKVGDEEKRTSVGLGEAYLVQPDRQAITQSGSSFAAGRQAASLQPDSWRQPRRCTHAAVRLDAAVVEHSGNSLTAAAPAHLHSCVRACLPACFLSPVYMHTHMCARVCIC